MLDCVYLAIPSNPQSQKLYTAGLLGLFWNNMLLDMFASRQQRFGRVEERGHSSVERNWDPSPLWRGRKSGRRPQAERDR